MKQRLTEEAELRKAKNLKDQQTKEERVLKALQAWDKKAASLKGEHIKRQKELEEIQKKIDAEKRSKLESLLEEQDKW